MTVKLCLAHFFIDFNALHGSRLVYIKTKAKKYKNLNEETRF